MAAADGTRNPTFLYTHLSALALYVAGHNRKTNKIIKFSTYTHTQWKVYLFCAYRRRRHQCCCLPPLLPCYVQCPRYINRSSSAISIIISSSGSIVDSQRNAQLFFKKASCAEIFSFFSPSILFYFLCSAGRSVVAVVRWRHPPQTHISGNRQQQQCSCWIALRNRHRTWVWLAGTTTGEKKPGSRAVDI